MVKRNLTLSLPVDLIQSAKVVAAKRGTSLNAMVRDSLERLVSSQDDYQAAVERLLAQGGLFRSTRKVSREELYDR
jgi:hypothetical protein